MKSLEEYLKESISHFVDEIENDDKKTGKNHWILQGKIQAYEDIWDYMERSDLDFYKLQEEYDD